MTEDFKEFVEIFRINVVEKFPYLVPLIYDIEFKELKSETNIAFTDGRKIFINWQAIKDLDNRKRIGIVLHEIIHIANAHTIVKNDFLKNLAMDIVINYILEEIGYSLKGIGVSYEQFGFTREEVRNSSWEDIYEKLKNKKISIKTVGFKIGGKVYEEEVNISEERKREIAEKVVEGLQIAERLENEKRGLDALGEFLKTQFFRSQIDWRRILLEEVRSLLPKNYSFVNPNKKYLQFGLYLPGIERENEIDLNILIDTSGSIVEKKDLLSKYVSEVLEIARQFRINGKLIVHDVDVYADEKLESLNSRKLKEILSNLRGGGGTSHKEALKRIKRNSLTIMFTDGYSDLEECVLPKKVIFVVGEDYNKDLEEMGKVIKLK